MMDRQCQQVCVSDLAVPGEASVDPPNGFDQSESGRKKVVARKFHVGFEDMEGVGGRESAGRKRRIRQNSYQRGLREGARRPSGPRVTRKPAAHSLVRLVLGPCQCDQHVGIQQENPH